MKIAAFPNNSGSRYWRLEGPFKYLRRKGHDARVITEGGITDEVAQWADIVVLQSCVDKRGIALLHAYQQERGLKLIVDADDFYELNDDNPHAKAHEVLDSAAVVSTTMELATMVTTTTPYLAEKIRPLNKNTFALANSMDLDIWDLPKRKNDGRALRVGWAGSITHLDDLRLLEDPLRRLASEIKNLQLVFVGDPRIKEVLTGLPVEVVLGTLV